VEFGKIKHRLRYGRGKSRAFLWWGLRPPSFHFFKCVVVTQVPLHGIRLSQRELHQMNVPDVKVETQNASIRNDERSASLLKSVKAQIASNWL